MPGTDREVVRPSRWVLLFVVVLLLRAVASLAEQGLRDGLSWGIVAAAAVSAVLVPRVRTVLAPSGITTCNGLRERHLPWHDVAAVLEYGHGGVVLRDGTKVVLPAVRARAWARDGEVARNSSRYVADYARAAGHDVELREAPVP